MANRQRGNEIVYTSAEYADMHLIYGETRRFNTRGGVSYSARKAARIYGERYPNRHHPQYGVFLRVHNAFSEGRLPGGRGSEGRPRGPNVDVVIHQVREDPSTSVRAIQRITGIPKSSVQRILKRMKYHPYHIQKVQSLLSRDYAPRVQFCRRMLEFYREDPNFFDKVLWSDESACRKDGYINLHNLHSWRTANPHETRQDHSQYQFKINLWTGIFNGRIIGPVEIPSTLNSDNYLELLRDTLPGLLEQESQELRETMWLQNDGCPAHYGRQVRAYLDEAYPGRWIGRLGPILWPPRSPDLNPLDFFYWGCLKDRVYAKPIATQEELRQRVNQAAQEITAINLRPVKRNFLRRCRLCIRKNGRHFEHLL